MSKDKQPIYSLPNGGYRIRPSLFNPYTGRSEQKEFQNSKWTYEDAEKELKRIKKKSALYFKPKSADQKKGMKFIKTSNSKFNQANEDTLNDLCDRWIKNRVKDFKVSYNYTQSLNYDRYIRDNLGKKRISEITQMDITDWRTWLCNQKVRTGKKENIGKPLKDKTINCIITILSNLIKYGRQHESLNLGFEAYRVKENDEKYVAKSWSDEQSKLFLKCIDDNEDFDKALFSIYFLTGIRLNEGLGLHCSSVDFVKKTITIKNNLARIKKGNGPRSFTEGPTKGKDVTILPLADYELNLLKKLISNLEKVHGYNPEEFFIFGDIEPKSPNYARRHFDKYRDIAQKRYPEYDFSLNLHGIRHSVATSIGKLHGLLDVQQQLRHKDPATSLIYTHTEINPEITQNRSKMLHGE